MELSKFIICLITGAAIGWFASQIVIAEKGWTHKPMPVEVSISKKS